MEVKIPEKDVVEGKHYEYVLRGLECCKKSDFNKKALSPPISCNLLDGRHSLCDERGGDRVFDQNWQRNHLAELDSSGVCGSPECRVHWEAPGRPGNPLQELTLRGWSCGTGRRKGDADQIITQKSRKPWLIFTQLNEGVGQAGCCTEDLKQGCEPSSIEPARHTPESARKTEFRISSSMTWVFSRSCVLSECN